LHGVATIIVGGLYNSCKFHTHDFNQINNYSFHHVLLVSIDVFLSILNTPTSFQAIIMGLSLIFFHKQTFGMYLSIDITSNLLPFSIALAIIL
jgi:hypothetical protein